MHVLLLLPYSWDSAPGQRFRMEQWYPRLRASGVQFRVETLLTPEEQRTLYGEKSTVSKILMLTKSLVRRIHQMRHIGRFDAIWIHRAAFPVGPPLLERALLTHRAPIILEFDDAIYMADTARTNQRWAFLKFAQSKTARLCGMSDGIVVGNEYLAAYARQFNSNVRVIPTTIDTSAYPARTQYGTGGPLVLGWSGSRTTVAHLRTLDPVIQRLATFVPLRLHVIGTPSYPLDGVETRAVEWNSAQEVAELSQFDVGVMPLPDAEWARGKCGLKALQYMALGIPTLASPVGINSEIIQDGVSGFLPRTEDEWVQRLANLARNAPSRERIGRAGRRTVEEKYSADVAAPLALRMLESVCDHRTRHP